jgi:cytochrome c551/c552
MKRTFFAVCSILFAASVGVRAQYAVPGDVVSVFQKNCVSCHKGKMPPRGLSLEAARIAEAIDRASNETPELKIIDSASPEASYVLKKIRRGSDIKGKPMPPLKALEADDLKVLETWILGLKKVPVPSSAASAPGGRPYLSWKRTVTVKTAVTALPSTTSGS